MRSLPSVVSFRLRRSYRQSRFDRRLCARVSTYHKRSCWVNHARHHARTDARERSPPLRVRTLHGAPSNPAPGGMMRHSWFLHGKTGPGDRGPYLSTAAAFAPAGETGLSRGTGAVHAVFPCDSIVQTGNGARGRTIDTIFRKCYNLFELLRSNCHSIFKRSFARPAVFGRRKTFVYRHGRTVESYVKPSTVTT